MMTDLELMTPLQLTVMAYLSAAAWLYLFARWMVRAAVVWQRQRIAARYPVTRSHPANRVAVSVANAKKH